VVDHKNRWAVGSPDIGNLEVFVRPATTSRASCGSEFTYFLKLIAGHEPLIRGQRVTNITSRLEIAYPFGYQPETPDGEAAPQCGGGNGIGALPLHGEAPFSS